MFNIKQKILKIKKILGKTISFVSGIIILPIAMVVAIPKRIALLKNKNIRDHRGMLKVAVGNELVPIFQADHNRPEKVVALQSRIPFFILSLQNMYSKILRSIIPIGILGNGAALVLLLYFDPVSLSNNAHKIIPVVIGGPLFMTTALWSAVYLFVYPIIYYNYPYCSSVALDFIKDTVKKLFNKSYQEKNNNFVLSIVIDSMKSDQIAVPSSIFSSMRAANAYQAEDHAHIFSLMKNSHKAHFKRDINEFFFRKFKEIMVILQEKTPLPDALLPSIIEYAAPSFFNCGYDTAANAFGKNLHIQKNAPEHSNIKLEDPRMLMWSYTREEPVNTAKPSKAKSTKSKVQESRKKFQ